MGRLARRSSNSWRDGRTGAESLGVDAIWRRAHRHKADTQITHEGGGAADLKIAVGRQVDLLKRLNDQSPRCVEINIGLHPSLRQAVVSVSVPVRKRFEESTRLFRKGMLAAITGSVYPPDFPR